MKFKIALDGQKNHIILENAEKTKKQLTTDAQNLIRNKVNNLTITYNDILHTHFFLYLENLKEMISLYFEMQKSLDLDSSFLLHCMLMRSTERFRYHDPQHPS